MEKNYANKLIGASAVLDKLSGYNCTQLPANESIARPLTKLLAPMPEVIPEAWGKAVDRAEKSPDGHPIITAKPLRTSSLYFLGVASYAS